MQVFVPLVTVDVQPAKNGERPGIELTTRSCQCPPYEVALIRATWGKVHAQSITEHDMVEGANPLYELRGWDGKDPITSEVLRLTKKYPKVFSKVYREGEVEVEIQKCAKASNAFMEVAAQKEAERSVAAADKAAASLIKESQRAVADAYAKAEKRKGPGRPRKVTPVISEEPASADA